MTDFTGSSYIDYENQLRNDPMKINGIFRAPYCYRCGLETEGKDAWGNRACEQCLTSWGSASVDNNEIDDHHATEWMKAGK